MSSVSRRPPHPAGVIAGATALALLTWLGARGVGSVPALGPLLDPWAGAWSAARQARPPRQSDAVIPTLDGPVDVRIDARGVPHVYADTALDAIRALGYLIARDRLFQLELQTRAAAGTLTELIGERALALDRRQRELGLAWGARRALDALPADSPELALYQALADGINARIDTLSRADWPFEYHFLGRAPQRWRPLHSLLLQQRMAYTLSYGAGDLWRLRVAALVGADAADALYPVNSPIQEPIQPNGAGTARERLQPLPPPALADRAALREAEALLAAVPPPPAAPEGMVLGSNNWAVAAARSASGNAVLAGDPHLELTLPSIWYEVHLVARDDGLDVHGVTIPGVPGVVIGFTRRVAWSVTNNHADVVDFYRETLDDPDDPARYRLDGEWVDLQRREEVYRGPDGRVLDRQTHFYTHRGPLFRTGAGALSMRWLALEPGGTPPDVFLNAARAGDVDELMEAFADFAVPAQNFLMADATGRIAIRSTGRYPIRPAEGDATRPLRPVDGGDGRRIRDGTTRASDWRGFWPLESYPQAVDPAQGYLASANQQPVDPAVQPAYLGNNWTSPWRALRINDLLRSRERFTAAEVAAFQTDPGNAKARLLTPYFLAAAARADDGNEDGGVPAPARALLADWDYRYEAQAAAPLLFETALARLKRTLWDELQYDAAPPTDLPRPPWPSEAVLYALLAQPASPWWDRRATLQVVEDRDTLLRDALRAAWDELRTAHGPPSDGAWAWQRHRRATINHLARFPGLGRFDLPLAGGGPGNLNPSSGNGTHGASWRMVVELDGEAGPAARVIYPGGQSGNPASPWYDDRVGAWQRGELAEVVSPPSAARFDALAATGYRLRLVPGRRAAEASR